MSTPINNGGPAFPTVVTDPPSAMHGREHPETYSICGMSLRDWFAGQALVGWLAADANPNSAGISPPESTAENAYKYADAMLAHRDK
jgi:hypothetical protein